jgi:hypothetical protein
VKIVVGMQIEAYGDDTNARKFVSTILRIGNMLFISYFSRYSLLLVSIFVDLQNGNLKILLVRYLGLQ